MGPSHPGPPHLARPHLPVNAFEPSLEGVPRSITSQVSDLLLNQWDLADPTIDLATPYGAKPQPYIDIHYQARLHSAWEAAAASARPSPLPGLSFADLANPYTPLLKIWRTGFALDALTPTTLTLYAAPNNS
ncbi:hypothetical protein ACFQHO_28100 [Actinomadura yumaensis]|uniref:hypothetical protein n=1 Tax=Actinomadura yumaensis TaxID=111807 RepID=UPI00360952C9